MNKSPEQQLAFRYAQIADARKFAEMRDIISADFTQQGPNWQCQGADAFIEQLQVLETNFSATLHMVGNQLGQWNGDCYEGETYSIASHLFEKDGVARKLEMAILYQERIEKDTDSYRYTRRDVNIVWTSDQPLQID
jgi:hypothetical protein